MKARKLTLCSIFSALIAIGAFIKIDIPLPGYTMHFTFQWLFVIMAALLLEAARGTMSVGVYLLMGLIGLPVFAAGGGPSYVLRPGFGFLLGFLLAAFIMGKLSEINKKNSLMHLLPISVVGMIAYYAIGACYFYLIKNLYTGETFAFSVIVIEYCLITVIPDFILCICACMLSVRLKPHMAKWLYEM